MSTDTTATVMPFPGNLAAPAPTGEAVEPFTSVVLQGAFESDAAREEFLQAISMHGVTFLRTANSPLPRPTIDVLSSIERLARKLNKVWLRQSSKGART